MSEPTAETEVAETSSPETVTEPVDTESVDIGSLMDDAGEMSDEALSEMVTSVSDDSAQFKEPEEPHLKIEAKQLLSHMKLFASQHRSLADVLARACLMVVHEDSFSATMSNGTVSNSVVVPIVNRTEGVPDTIIIDYESLMKVSALAGEFVYLVYVDDVFYVDFFGGRIHIPTFVMKPEDIVNRVTLEAEPVDGTPVDAVQMLQAINIARNYLAANQLPTLDFAFMFEDGMLLSNGFTALKTTFEFPVECTLRKADLPFLTAMCDISIQEQVHVFSVGTKLVFRTSKVQIILPKFTEKFPSGYSNHLQTFLDRKDKFTVDFAKFYLLLNMLSKVYRTSGVVQFKATDGILIMKSRSLDDKVSHLDLAEDGPKEMEADLSFSVQGLLAVLRAIKVFKHMDLAIVGQAFQLSNETAALVVFGTGSDIKSKVFNMKKAAKRAEYAKK